VGVNRMVSSGPHAPVALNALAIATGVPSDGSTILSRPCAMNASVPESDDQNGDAAPSVPAIGVAASDASGRSHNCCVPEGSVAANARRSPFGEMANRPMPPIWPAAGNLRPSGRITDVR
jgi:hypothetical protein